MHIYKNFPEMSPIPNHISYMYEFIETCRGRELIFQKYSYSRFRQSNVYHCSSKNPQICYAQVMLDDGKILIISSYHNHSPPFLLRDKHGVLIKSYNVRDETKPKRRGKPTLGPRATRNQVDTLVASIMNTVKAMKNQTETAEPNVNEVAVPAEAEAGPSNEAAPRVIEKRFSVPKTKKKVTPGNNQANSAVTSTKKNEPLKNVINSSHMNSLLKVISINKNELPQDKNNTGFSEINPSQETVVPREVGTVPLLKHGAGSLVPNQMYIILPNVESGIQHNRFILAPPNVGGLVYGNRILVSPIQTEHNTVVTSNNKKMQLINMKNFPTIDNAMSKKIDINTEVPNKMFLLVQTNNMNPMTSRINDSASFVSSNIELTTPNETSTLVNNKALIHNKNENDLLVSSNTQPKQHINVSEPSDTVNMPQKEIKTPKVSSTMPKLQPKRLEMKTSIPIASIKNLKFPHEKFECTASPTNINNVPLKSNDSWAVGNTSILKKPETSETIFNNVEPKTTNKNESIASDANDISVPLMTPKINEMHNKVKTVASNKSETICPFDTVCTNETQTSNIVPKKLVKIAPKKNGIDRPVYYISQRKVPKKAGSSKVHTFAAKTENYNDKFYDSEPLVQLKPETFSAAIGNIKPIASNKDDSDDQITHLDRKVAKKTEVINNEQKTQKKTEDGGSVSTLPSTVQPQNKIENDSKHINVPKQKPMTFMESYMKALEKNSRTNSTDEANTSKKSTSTLKKVQLIPSKKKKSDMTDNLKSKYSKTNAVDAKNGNIQSIIKKKETADPIETSSLNIDFDCILPKNEKVEPPKQAKTDFLSKTNIKEIDNNTSSIASNIPEVPIPVIPEAPIPVILEIPVSMIPLPTENDSTRPGTMSVASMSPLVLKESQPLVMIERLPMKHKAGSSNMRSVPLKKRYYQF